MRGYGSYSNAYGAFSGQTGLSKGAGTGSAPHNPGACDSARIDQWRARTADDCESTGNLSDEEKIAAPTGTEESASTPAGEIDRLMTSAHQHLKGLEAKVGQLTDHLEDHKHPTSPAHTVARSMQDHIDQIKDLLAKVKDKTKAHCATHTSTGAPSSASYSAPYSAPAIPAHSMGRAPSAYSRGSYSRYRY